MTGAGQRFFKMSGSGNDFVFFDARRESLDHLATPEAIGRLCERGTGVGADGVVFLADSPDSDLAIHYYNRDGSLASLCGNASLCATNLAVSLGAVSPAGFRLGTGSGVLAARIRDGLPEIELSAVPGVQTEVAGVPMQPTESHLGFGEAGVPHVVLTVSDLESADVAGRGRELRRHPAFPEGANVNFVAPAGGGEGWQIRTYERGVERETLACGTGAVASAILLNAWGLTGAETTLQTRSGSFLTVTLERSGSSWRPWLRGPGQLVFEGVLRDLT